MDSIKALGNESYKVIIRCGVCVVACSFVIFVNVIQFDKINPGILRDLKLFQNPKLPSNLFFLPK